MQPSRDHRFASMSSGCLPAAVLRPSLYGQDQGVQPGPNLLLLLNESETLGLGFIISH